MLVIANTETVYEFVEDKRTPVKTTTREQTVYTLHELRELDRHAYNEAIAQTIQWSWEGWETSWLTEDLIYDIREDYPAFELNAKTLEWDMYQAWAKGKGTVSLQRYLTDHRLRNKYRALWHALKTYELWPDVEVSFGISQGYGIWGYCNIYEGEIYVDSVDAIVDNKDRYKLIMDQLDRLEIDIANWMGQIYSELRKRLRDENHYRCSEEFAREEADAQDLRFTAEGKLYHG